MLNHPTITQVTQYKKVYRYGNFALWYKKVRYVLVWYDIRAIFEIIVITQVISRISDCIGPNYWRQCIYKSTWIQNALVQLGFGNCIMKNVTLNGAIGALSNRLIALIRCIFWWCWSFYIINFLLLFNCSALYRTSLCLECCYCMSDERSESRMHSSTRDYFLCRRSHYFIHCFIWLATLIMHEWWV